MNPDGVGFKSHIVCISLLLPGLVMCGLRGIIYMSVNSNLVKNAASPSTFKEWNAPDCNVLCVTQALLLLHCIEGGHGME